MINMKFFRVVLALLGGTHVLCAQPSASPTVKSTGEYFFFYANPFSLNIDIEDSKDNEKSLEGSCGRVHVKGSVSKGGTLSNYNRVVRVLFGNRVKRIPLARRYTLPGDIIQAK